jgi:hypothetical protein
MKDILEKLNNGEKVQLNGWTFWISNNVLIRNSIKSDLDELFKKCDLPDELKSTNLYKELKSRLK